MRAQPLLAAADRFLRKALRCSSCALEHASKHRYHNTIACCIQVDPIKIGAELSGITPTFSARSGGWSNPTAPNNGPAIRPENPSPLLDGPVHPDKDQQRLPAGEFQSESSNQCGDFAASDVCWASSIFTFGKVVDPILRSDALASSRSLGNRRSYGNQVNMRCKRQQTGLFAAHENSGLLRDRPLNKIELPGLHLFQVVFFPTCKVNLAVH